MGASLFSGLLATRHSRRWGAPYSPTKLLYLVTSFCFCRRYSASPVLGQWRPAKIQELMPTKTLAHPGCMIARLLLLVVLILLMFSSRCEPSEPSTTLLFLLLFHPDSMSGPCFHHDSPRGVCVLRCGEGQCGGGSDLGGASRGEVPGSPGPGQSCSRVFMQSCGVFIDDRFGDKTFLELRLDIHSDEHVRWKWKKKTCVCVFVLRQVVFQETMPSTSM